MAMSAFQSDPDIMGVGFVFTSNDPYCGIDLDDCRDAETGDITPWAQEIIDTIASYSEVSPSGTGVKIFVRGEKAGTGRRKGYKSGEVEVYSKSRYFTVTGERLSGDISDVMDRQEQLDELCIKVFGKEKPAPTTVTPQPARASLSDDEIVKLVSSSRKKNAKFADLWNGRWNDYYNSASEGDGSLVFKIAYYTKDAGQIDRVFRRSGLYRDKWDEMHGEDTYGAMTIGKALSKVTAQYKPKKKARKPKKSPPGVACTKNRQPVPGSIHHDTGRLILDMERTLPTAETFVRDHYMHEDGPTLKHYANMFFGWHDNRYTEAEDSYMRHQLLPWLNRALRAKYSPAEDEWIFYDFPANPRTVSAALDSIKAYTHIPATLRPPLWLKGDGGRPPPHEILACKSSLLHLPTMAHSQPTPSFFSFNALDFDPDPTAEEPVQWLAFLDQVMGTDEESKVLLQDWFGYCLTGDTSQQKMLLMVGPKRSGKGTIARVLTHLVGAGNVCGPTTSSLAGDFGLQPLIGKNLAVVSDARFSGKRIQIVVERLLCISGEDLLTVDRKHLPSVSLQLPTRFVFLTNEIPRLCDASGALAGRFMVLELTESFYGREDKELTGKLTAELPGILNWAIDGWKRLQERGKFVQPKSVGRTLKDMENLASPVLAFVEECCDLGMGLRCKVGDLYGLYRLWGKWEGHSRSPTKQSFGRDLNAAVSGLRVRRNHTDGRFYDGINLKTEYQELLCTERAKQERESSSSDIAEATPDPRNKPDYWSSTAIGTAQVPHGYCDNGNL
nr:hypothetical protein 1 [Flavobacteriaceae bacterium]